MDYSSWERHLTFSWCWDALQKVWRGVELFSRRLYLIGEDLETLRALNKFFKDNYPRIEKLFADCKIIESNKLDNKRV